MSTTDTPTTTDWETVREVATENPLAHPLATAMGLFEYEYPPPEHVREIYGAVYRALAPDTRAPKNLARLTPREHAKSESGTVVVPTWAALRDPNVRVLIMSETETQATNKLRECREHIERLGPAFGRKIEESSKTALTLEREATHDVPTITAAGFKTGVTGGHFDIKVFDDIVSAESQRTTHRRETTWETFQDYLNLGSEGESVRLVLGSRKHPKDVYHHLIQGPKWDSRVERAIEDFSIVENGEYDVIAQHQSTGVETRYEADEIALIDAETETIIEVLPHREVPVLWPERWPLEALIDDMIAGFGAEQGSLIWRRENQNDAEALQGQVLSADMLHWCPREDVPDAGLQLYVGVDVALVEDAEAAAREDSDYWAAAALAHHPPSDRSYLLDVERKRGLSMQRAIGWVRGFVNDIEAEWGLHAGKVLVESNQAQRWFVQEARDRDIRFEQTASSGSKEERIIDMTARFESGRVLLVDDYDAAGGPDSDAGAPARSPSWESFVSSWSAFPGGDHDDRLDATEIAMRGLSLESVEESDHDMSDLPI